LKILFLCHKTPYPANDGGTIATLNMIKGFQQLSHQVDVLMMQTPKHNGDAEKYPDALRENINWHQVWVDTKIKAGDALKNLLFSQLPYNAERFISDNFTNKLKELLCANVYDLVQLEGLYLAPYIQTIRENCASLISLRAHNVEYEIWQRMAQGVSNPVKKWYFNHIAKRVERMEVQAIGLVDIIVPITERDEGKLKGMGGSQYLSIPSGFDASGQKPIVENASKTFFYIGALDWLPNQEGLLWFFQEIWEPFKQENPAWEFVLAGRNAPQGFVDKIKGFPIKYIGEVDSAEAFINKHNIMIVPLLSGSGMRIKIVEGMAHGKCIVTTSIGAEGIPVSPGENIFIANNPKEYLAQMNVLANNEELSAKTGSLAWGFVQNELANEKLTSKLAAFYQNSLTARK
jgi:glycosyltransferase involved in cell wall biosynthesis